MFPSIDRQRSSGYERQNITLELSGIPRDTGGIAQVWPRPRGNLFEGEFHIAATRLAAAAGQFAFHSAKWQRTTGPAGRFVRFGQLGAFGCVKQSIGCISCTLFQFEKVTLSVCQRQSNGDHVCG